MDAPKRVPADQFRGSATYVMPDNTQKTVSHGPWCDSEDEAKKYAFEGIWPRKAQSRLWIGVSRRTVYCPIE